MNTHFPKLHFFKGFNDGNAWEAQQKGVLDHVIVEFSNGKNYCVCFLTPNRLASEARLLEKAGEPYLGYPGVILIPDVTKDHMQKAVEYLQGKNFFEHFVPTDKSGKAGSK